MWRFVTYNFGKDVILVLDKRLTALRKERKLTQQEVADALKISRGTYGHYEIGRREPDYKTLQQFAEFFGVTTDYLLGRDQYPDVNVSFELHEGAAIKSMEDIDYVLNETRKELMKAVNEGRISEEKAMLAVNMLRDQLTALLKVI